MLSAEASKQLSVAVPKLLSFFMLSMLIMLISPGFHLQEMGEEVLAGQHAWQPHTHLGFTSGTDGLIECIIELEPAKCSQIS